MDQEKFLCGRKHKFRLNCQAVSDFRGSILDILIKYGSSSSDCLAFEGSDLHRHLEEGLMKKDIDWPRSVLFGDNAYLNSSYIATPYPNVSADVEEQWTRDNYIFITCSFELDWSVHLACLSRDGDSYKLPCLAISLFRESLQL